MRQQEEGDASEEETRGCLFTVVSPCGQAAALADIWRLYMRCLILLVRFDCIYGG